jgi:hypothetical protein
MIQSRWGSFLVAAVSSNKLSPFGASFCVSTQSRRLSSRPSTRLYASSLPPKGALSDDAIESEVMAWVHRVVVGWNLCPFADKPLKQGKLFLHTVRGSDEETILGTVVAEMVIRKDSPGTTLVIAPECYPNDFATYLSFVNALETDLMEEYELHGHVQVAPFHPLFEISGSGKDGIDNYTNRAPYPIFHVLRESEVETAVDKLGGDASRVWKRNVDLLEDMQDTLGDNKGVMDAMNGDSPSLKQKVDEVLKRHRFKLNDKLDD